VTLDKREYTSTSFYWHISEPALNWQGEWEMKEYEGKVEKELSP